MCWTDRWQDDKVRIVEETPRAKVSVVARRNGVSLAIASEFFTDDFVS